MTERPRSIRVGQGKWAVEAVNEDALAFWSSEPQAAAIDAWPHDAELAAVDDYVLVRVPGLIDRGASRRSCSRARMPLVRSLRRRLRGCP